jgi:membrane protease subunit (stomatin/prohibitin family)
VVLLGVLMAATTLVGLAALRAFLPLVSTQEDRTAMVGQRTRVALEREKMLALRSIKELEFDRAMGKVSESDFREMSGRLRARASGLMRQLDAGGGYRDRIERDVAARLSSAKASAERASAEPPSPERPAIEHACSSCSTINDPDARFCKACGQKL